MCGRFNNHLQTMHAWANLLKNWPSSDELSYNVAPTTNIPMVTAGGVTPARWGIVPSWSEEFKTRYSTINARIESVRESRLYKSAWEEGRTCVIPAAGYYEWREENGVRNKIDTHYYFAQQQCSADRRQFIKICGGYGLKSRGILVRGSVYG